MFSKVKILLVIVAIEGLNGLNDSCNKTDNFSEVTCARDYFENVVLSKKKDTRVTIDSALLENVLTLDTMEHEKKSSNKTSDGGDLPYYVVPEISNYERDFINVLSQKYLKLQRPFDLSRVLGVSNVCREHSRKFSEALKGFELWALKMHDATAKISSGLLNGNVNNYGDFDQCLSVRATNEEFQSKYCLAWLQPTASKSLMYTNFLRKLLQSHERIESNFDDPGHRVPRFLNFNWAFCVPSTCSNSDVELGLKNLVKSFTNGTGVDVDVRVDGEMCQVKDENWIEKLDFGTKVTILFCLLLVISIGASTVYESQNSSTTKSNLLTSFSLIRNTKNLLSLERDSNDIKSAHGIRFFNAVMLVLSHKCLAVFFDPHTNRTELIETTSRPWGFLFMAISLYTDTFLMLSGMLTAYSLSGKLKRHGKINIFKEYASRYLRIIPPLAFLIAFCTFILPLLGSGPQWNLVVSHHSEICKQYWWRNLLFIHNWFGFSNMCLTHTHHVGIDTELFLTAPLLILAMWKWPKQGTRAIVLLATLSTVARYYVTYTSELSNYFYFGTSINKLFETADKMYSLPPHRFTVYAMGIGLGFVLRLFKEIKFTQSQLKIGWYLSTASLLLAYVGPAPMGLIDYKYNATHAAHYAAFAPIAWCIFSGWIILVSQMGHTNKFIRALEWKGFLVCTKLSYGLYLTQFPLFFYNVGRVRAPIHYRIFGAQIDMNENLCIILATIAMTLLVEMPSNNIRSWLLDEKRKTLPKPLQTDANGNVEKEKI